MKRGPVQRSRSSHYLAFRRGQLALMVICVTTGLAAGAAAEVFRYVDSAGVTHFTNAPRGRHYAAVTKKARPVRAPSISKFDAVIESAARKQGVPPALVKAVVAAESAFRVDVVSHKGAMGLMQLMPATAKALGVEEPFRAADNIHGGARYLRAMHDRYGSWSHALAAYNAGPRAVDRYRGIPPYRETRTYVKRVLTYYRQFHGDFAQ